jgi:hypothetical protein
MTHGLSHFTIVPISMLPRITSMQYPRSTYWQQIITIVVGTLVHEPIVIVPYPHTYLQGTTIMILRTFVHEFAIITLASCNTNVCTNDNHYSSWYIGT